MRLSRLTGSACFALMAVTGAASASHLNYYAADLGDINNFGITGRAALTLNTEANTLKVQIRAKGLEPDMLHVQHIHGTFDDAGNPTDAVSPSFAAGSDADGDGVIELLEGVPSYGPIVLSLDDEAGGFPTAPGGLVAFSHVYDLMTTPSFGDGFDMTDLIPLDFREIVLHGGFLAEGIGGVGNETGDIPAGYSAFVPVAAGEIRSVDAPAAVPLPAAGWLMLAGLGGIGALSRRRKRA